MSVPASCDAVVVGGGPAGSVAAASLSRAGYDVVLLDRQRRPRNAVGESPRLTDRSERLHALDADAVPGPPG